MTSLVANEVFVVAALVLISTVVCGFVCTSNAGVVVMVVGRGVVVPH